jgi:flagellar biosynthesis anti-sigma factor FlgM
MTIPIYSDKNSISGNLHTTIKNQNSATVSKTQAIIEAKKVTPDLKKSDNSIQISHEAQVLSTYIKSTPSEEIDWDKVNKIKSQIDSGSYTINYQQVADKMLDFENKII